MNEARAFFVSFSAAADRPGRPALTGGTSSARPDSCRASVGRLAIPASAMERERQRKCGPFSTLPSACKLFTVSYSPRCLEAVRSYLRSFLSGSCEFFLTRLAAWKQCTPSRLPLGLYTQWPFQPPLLSPFCSILCTPRLCIDRLYTVFRKNSVRPSAGRQYCTQNGAVHGHILISGRQKCV